MTSEAGDNETGHIDTKQNEGILFFDSEYLQAYERNRASALTGSRCVSSEASMAEPDPLL